MSSYFYNTIISFIYCFFFILNVNAQDYQVSKSQVMFSDEELSFFMPVNFTGQGVNKFLKNIYNKPAYLELLPNNFSHFVQFLEFGAKTKQKDHYIKSVVRLFSKKLKAIPYVNAYAYSYLLEKLPPVLDCYVTTRTLHDHAETKDKISGLIYEAFVSRFSLCKTDPESFLGGLSNQIFTVVAHESDIVTSAVGKEQIRQLMVRFFELGISKLVWSPSDHKEIWDSVKSIGEQLANLHERKVISQADDLDDLYWSLVHRFCYFIDLSGEDLPLQFYATVKKDVAEHAATFLVLEEQESAIETKAQTLAQALMHGEARARARDRGMVIRA